MPEPYPQNVAGDFYVEAGCCTCCDVPRTEAPDLFAYADDGGGFLHCFVCKQPADEGELDDMLRVIRCAELACIRYRGDDTQILQRLTALGEADVCDVLTEPADGSQVPRKWWRFG